MDHKHQRPLRLEGKSERRLSPLNPLASVINTSNSSTLKNEENTYVQSQLRKSTLNEKEKNEVISNGSVSSTTSPISANNNNSISTTLTTPTNVSSANPTNSNIKNVSEDVNIKRKSITGMTPSLRRLSRCLSDANEVTLSNNDDLNFSISSSALTQSTATSVRPIPIPNPLPHRRISRGSISLENDENIMNPSSSSYANPTSSVKSNATNTTFNNQPSNYNSSNSYQSTNPNPNNPNNNPNNNLNYNNSNNMNSSNLVQTVSYNKNDKNKK